MQNAITRIDELQEEIKDKANSIDGANAYVEKQLKFYREDEELREKFKLLNQKQQKTADEFFSQH